MEAKFVAGLPVERIEAAYRAAGGNEIDSGKFANCKSSAALAANTFGRFCFECANDLPALPGTEGFAWPATFAEPEVSLRFPWSGGRHPWLDVVIATNGALIGVEA